MNTDKIAEIIRLATYTHTDTSQIIAPEDLINALADYFENADKCNCGHPAPHLMECPAKWPFDREAWVRIATGE